MSSGPNVKVTCSCGETCIIRENRKKGEYEADDPNWKWDDDRFWHCGKNGHRRMTSIEVSFTGVELEPEPERPKSLTPAGPVRHVSTD